MNFDTDTMIVMMVLSSLLQAGILLSLIATAHEYKGMSNYVLGTLFSALSFGWVIVIKFAPPPALSMKLLGNLMLAASMIFSVAGIGQFVGRKIDNFLWIFSGTLFSISQIYYLYVDDNYFWRNIALILIGTLAYGVSIRYMIGANIRNFLMTGRCLTAVLLLGICIFLMRGVFLVDSQTQSALDATLANIFTFFGLFIFDFLRNGFFVLMVSQRMYSELHKMSEIDFLTQIFNRGAIAVKAEDILAKKKVEILTLILLDVDHFKKINDTHGHHIGDLVLQQVTRSLQSQLNPPDLIGRWGGEEFLIVLPDCPPSKARDRADSLRLQVANNPVFFGADTGTIVNCTISLGVVTDTAGNHVLDELLKRADEALYKAKTGGRNRAEFVVLSPTPIEK